MGRVFGDNNSNGIKDSDEVYIPYIPVNLNNWEITYSNNYGEYGLSTKDTGSYNLNVTAPPYYKAVPEQSKFSFSKYDNILSLPDIAIQPTMLKDSMGIYVYTLQEAVPGRFMSYSIEYRNYGTLNEYSTISFTYDTSKLIFDSASVKLISHSGNVLVWKDTLIANYFGNDYLRNGFRYPVLFFKVKTNAQIGTSLKYAVSIVSAKTSATASDSIIVRGSYDPNSKDATPQLSTVQVANGESIDYIIHFQNVGTAPAYNIVIADTLSNLLTPNSLQLIGSSHNVNIVMDSGIIYFQFFNINLTDSGTNQLMSNGFVHFRLMPKSTVTSGSTINNKASIYFDYNKPVVTNTATTAINNIVMPINIVNYQARQLKEGQIENDWITTNEQNTAVFNVQRSKDGVNFIGIGSVVARGDGANSYRFIDKSPANGVNFYRLQIIDKDGTASYSKVVSITFPIFTSPFSIYPNPAKDFATIHFSKAVEKATIAVYDITGKAVITQSLNGSIKDYKLNTQTLPNGLYVVKVNTETCSYNEKLLISK